MESSTRWSLGLLLASSLLLAAACSEPAGPSPVPDAGSALPDAALDPPDAAIVPPDAGLPDAGPVLTREEVFQELGISTVPRPRTDPRGNPLRAGYNPLGSLVANLGAPKREIYLAGSQFRGRGAKEQALVDDLPFTPEQTVTPGIPLLEEADDAWMDDNPKKSVAADVDGDGLDEIVVAAFYRPCCSPAHLANRIALRVVDPKTGLGEQVALIDVTSLDFDAQFAGRANVKDDSNEWSRSWGYACSFFRRDLTAGDFDGDGKEELAVLVGQDIFLLDDRAAGYAQLAHEQLPVVGGGGGYLRMDRADFDQDGRDELIVANGCDEVGCVAKVTIFDGPDLGTKLLDALPLELNHNETAYYGLLAADVATGDFDADGLPDAAFVGHRNDGDGYRNTYVLVLRTEMNAESQPVFGLVDTVSSMFFDDTDQGGKPRFVLQGVAAGDFDGEPGDEIVTFDNVYKLQDDLGRLQLTTPFGWSRLRLPFAWSLAVDYPRGDSMAMGDVNGDGKEDVLYVSHDGDQLFVISHVQGTELQYNVVWLNGVDFFPTLALPNTDHDSTVVQYMGSEVTYTDPFVLSVLASPPYWAGINDDGEGETSLGEVSGSGSGMENSMGIHAFRSVGAVIGASVYGLVRVEAEVKATLEKSFTWGMAVDWSYSENWGYVTGLGEDRVVFTAMPYDVYSYKVLSSPDGEGIGEPITINVPRAPARYNTTVAFYNAHNGPYEDIGRDVLPHTAGDPFSYYTRADRDAIKARVGERSISEGYGADDVRKGIFPDVVHAVGEGGAGTTSVEVEKTCTESHEFAWATSATIELQVTVAWFTLGAGAGVHTEHSYNMSSTEGIYLGGSVPSIPSEFYDGQHRFDWGLMSYPHTTAGGQSYTVLNYFVDPN